MCQYRKIFIKQVDIHPRKFHRSIRYTFVQYGSNGIWSPFEQETVFQFYFFPGTLPVSSRNRIEILPVISAFQHKVFRIFTYNGHHTFSTRVSSGSRYSVQSQFLEQMFRRSLILISVGIPPFKHRLIRIDIFAAIDQRSAFSHPVCQKIMISGFHRFHVRIRHYKHLQPLECVAERSILHVYQLHRYSSFQ